MGNIGEYELVETGVDYWTGLLDCMEWSTRLRMVVFFFEVIKA